MFLVDSDSLEGNIDGSDGVGLSANASSYAPSCAPSKSNEKTSSPCEQPEVPAPSKAPSEPQSINSHGRPGSSVSSNSECAVSASASSGPGLSPSSSVGSLSSERSTLNPHARVLFLFWVLCDQLTSVLLRLDNFNYF